MQLITILDYRSPIIKKTQQKRNKKIVKCFDKLFKCETRGPIIKKEEKILFKTFVHYKSTLLSVEGEFLKIWNNTNFSLILGV